MNINDKKVWYARIKKKNQNLFALSHYLSNFKIFLTFMLVKYYLFLF